MSVKWCQASLSPKTLLAMNTQTGTRRARDEGKTESSNTIHRQTLIIKPWFRNGIKPARRRVTDVKNGSTADTRKWDDNLGLWNQKVRDKQTGSAEYRSSNKLIQELGKPPSELKSQLNRMSAWNMKTTNRRQRWKTGQLKITFNSGNLQWMFPKKDTLIDWLNGENAVMSTLFRKLWPFEPGFKTPRGEECLVTAEKHGLIKPWYKTWQERHKDPLMQVVYSNSLTKNDSPGSSQYALSAEWVSRVLLSLWGCGRIWCTAYSSI